MVEIFSAMGTVQTEKHYSTIRTLIPVVPTLLPHERDFCSCVQQCIPDLKLLTDKIGSDTYKNDWFTMYQNKITSGSNKVFIVVDNEEIEITDNSYGNEYDGSYFYGYKFLAYEIWQMHGFGKYIFIARTYDTNGEIVLEETSPQYYVMEFSDNTANGTVVIETKKNGTLRHGKSYYDLSFPLSKTLPFWFQRVRLPGKLKVTGYPLELSGVVMNNLQQDRQQVFDTMNIEYDLEVHLVSASQILPVIFDDMFANTVTVTDYNVYNFEAYTSLRMLRTGIEVKPRVRKRQSFVFKMQNEQKQFEKYND
jgi:hypothetical protein